MNVLTLQSGRWHLELLPDLGGSVLNLLGRGAGGWRPVLRMVHPLGVQASSQAASFTLAPFSNRIRDARFQFQGRQVQLRPTRGGLTQHGDVRNRPWQVEAQGADRVTLHFDGRAFPDLNWPWPFTMRVGHELDGASLHTRLALTNTADSAMPAGFGLHPYFVRRGADGSDPSLLLKAARVYDVDAEQLPVGAARPVDPALDFRRPRPVGEARIDRVYTDWDGVAALDWGSRRLALRADPVFSQVVLFSAPDGSLAIEPVSNATDGFNLLARGVPGTGVRVLEPGETLSGTVTLTLEGEW